MDLVPGDAGNEIALEQIGDEWHVRVSENGQQTVNSFVLESYAVAYAEGQRMRLGLDEILYVR